MNPMTMSEPRPVADDTYALTAHLPVPGFGVLPVNAFVIDADDPILVDIRLATVRDDFMAVLRQLIDPATLKWIWLTHIDPDHIGNLASVIDPAPQARLVTSFVGMGKLNMHRLPIDRAYLQNPGQRLELGDRHLLAVSPPVFDAPETAGALDSKTGALFSADCFGALLAEPLQAASDVAAHALREGMTAWATVDAPWLQMVARNRFETTLEDIRRLQPEIVLSSHLPPAGGLNDMLLENMAAALENSGVYRS